MQLQNGNTIDNTLIVLTDKNDNADQRFIIRKFGSSRKKIEYGKGTYGRSGASIHGVYGGTELQYYKYGSGPNVLFATFVVHGFEDSWNYDGIVLRNIANNFYSRLIADNDYDLAEKWTIYIFPEVNPDSLRLGYTNNGPGRTTVYSSMGRGIDINRCWQTGSNYIRYTSARNYNGTSGFQAYEAEALRNFMLSHKSINGQTVVIDLHGWEDQLIRDAGFANYYKNEFTSCATTGYGRYGTQYLISWARNNLGARSVLVELPLVHSEEEAQRQNLSGKYITATIKMLKGE